MIYFMQLIMKEIMQLMKISVVPYMMKNYVKNRYTRERKYSGRVREIG